MRIVDAMEAQRPLTPERIRQLTLAITSDTEEAARAEAWAILNGLRK